MAAAKINRPVFSSFYPLFYPSFMICSHVPVASDNSQRGILSNNNNGEACSDDSWDVGISSFLLLVDGCLEVLIWHSVESKEHAKRRVNRQHLCVSFPGKRTISLVCGGNLKTKSKKFTALHVQVIFTALQFVIKRLLQKMWARGEHLKVQCEGLQKITFLPIKIRKVWCTLTCSSL